MYNVQCIYKSVQRQHCLATSMFHRMQEDNKPDPWAMTDTDIAVYDKAFVKLDKDKDGFISLHGQYVVHQAHHVLGTCILHTTEFVV